MSRRVLVDYRDECEARVSDKKEQPGRLCRADAGQGRADIRQQIV